MFYPPVVELVHRPCARGAGVRSQLSHTLRATPLGELILGEAPAPPPT